MYLENWTEVSFIVLYCVMFRRKLAYGQVTFLYYSFIYMFVLIS